MSRLARKPIVIPAGVTATQEGSVWVFRGSKGEIRHHFPPVIQIFQKENELHVQAGPSGKKQKHWAYAMLGTTAALLRNAIKGISEGFEKQLELEGVGYKVQLDGKDLVFSLGFSHPIRRIADEGISFAVEKNVIIVRGVDKSLVGKVAAEIRELKTPEPYKGKGIHYVGEFIRRKAGKKAVSAT